MRIYLYLIAGITSPLIGWNIAQFFLVDLNWLRSFPELILFPCVAISLALGMVLNEIFISSPTRPKLCLRKAITPFFIAVGLGLGFGLLSGGISQILFLPAIGMSAATVRTVGWLMIGIAVGLAEGLTWRWETIEAGDKKRFRQRFITSLVGSIVASLIAAFVFEYFHSFLKTIPNGLKAAEDLVGFSLLGSLLGLTFSLTGSPSYLVALRAGKGFEYTGDSFEEEDEEEDNDDDDNHSTGTNLERLDQNSPTISRTKTSAYPTIKNKRYGGIITFVSDEHQEKIQEGLSIKLPSKGTLKIGSLPECDIQLHDLPSHVADLELKHRETILIPYRKNYRYIRVNGKQLKNDRSVILKHNYLLSFYPKNNNNLENVSAEKIYRFVYYNRFLDPQG